MFAIVVEPIDVATLAHAVASDAYGAVVTFAGHVRDRDEQGRLVSALFYEAHAQMAEAEFAAIAAEAAARFGPCEIAVRHRTGRLRVGEISVAVAVAAPHRSAAFGACAYTIDELKRRAAIWKKELYADGEGVWKSHA